MKTRRIALWVAILLLAFIAAAAMTGCGGQNPDGKNGSDSTGVTVEKNCSPNVGVITDITPIEGTDGVVRYSYKQINADWDHAGDFNGKNGDFKLHDSVYFGQYGQQPVSESEAPKKEAE